METVMTEVNPRWPWRALLGPAVMGMCMGLGAGLGVVVLWGATLPLMLAGLAVVMIPALYIATSLAGSAPPARDMGRHALTALDDVGTMLLGLAPALGFMVVTTQNQVTVFVATVFVAISMILGLRALFLRLFVADRPLWAVPAGTLVAYLAWTVVSLGIGAQWFIERAFGTLGGGQ